MMGKEALVVLSILIQLTAVKMDKPISHFTGWFIIQITITVARSYYRVLHVA